jgi:hypothetical protein
VWNGKKLKVLKNFLKYTTYATYTMDASKFNDILASLKEMDDRQKFDLFHTIREELGLIIPFYTSRINIDEWLDNCGKKPLNDEEWEEIEKHIQGTLSWVHDDYLGSVEHDALMEVRGDYQESEEGNDEVFEQRMDIVCCVKDDEHKQEFTDNFNAQFNEHSRCDAHIDWRLTEDDDTYKWIGMCVFSTTDKDHPLIESEMIQYVEDCAAECVGCDN